MEKEIIDYFIDRIVRLEKEKATLEAALELAREPKCSDDTGGRANIGQIPCY